MDSLAEFDIALKNLTQSRFGRRSFLASIPLLMAACASNPKNVKKELTVDDEKFMAREALPELRRDYPALRDAEIQNYVSNLGARLVAANSLAGNPYDYTFTVVDVPLINAFALPAGTIFVTGSLIQATETEAELAGVLGHEIGHVTARHAAQRVLAQQQAKENSWWYSGGGALVGGVAAAGAATLICRGGVRVCSSELIVLGAMAGVSGGLLIQKYKFLAQTQENELEADHIGFKTVAQSGYATEYIGAFYTRLQKMESPGNLFSDALKTHPPSAERTKQINQLVQSNPQKPGATVSSLDFDNIRKKISSFSQQTRIKND
jgi:predicted Zn-dependent protease